MCSDLKREAEVRIILMFLRTVVLAALTTTTFVWMPTAARAGGRCPDIRGSLNPLESSHVMRTFTDIDGCAVPLRVGIGHIPWMQSVDFGYEHIVSRAREGAVEHEYSAAAMKQWQLALLNAGGPSAVITNVIMPTTGWGARSELCWCLWTTRTTRATHTKASRAPTGSPATGSARCRSPYDFGSSRGGCASRRQEG